MVNEKAETISEYYEISNSRVKELLDKLDPKKFDGGIEFVEELHKEVSNDDELNFMIAHLTSCLVHVFSELMQYKKMIIPLIEDNKKING